MKRFARLGVFVCLLGCAVASLGYANRELVEDWGLDFWNYSRFEREMNDSQRTTRLLAANHERTAWRLSYRQNLMEELLAGRATIEQTLEQFEEMNRTGSLNPELLRVMMHANSDRETAVRQLLLYLGTQSLEQPRVEALRQKVKAILASLPVS